MPQGLADYLCYIKLRNSGGSGVVVAFDGMDIPVENIDAPPADAGGTIDASV